MSRIGKKAIPIPEGVEVKIEKSKVSIKGPKGTLDFDFDPRIQIREKDREILIRPREGDVQIKSAAPLQKARDKDQPREIKALWGLTRSLIQNQMIGVTKGFEKKLEIHGVGYRAKAEGRKLTLELGFSQAVDYEIPKGIEVKVEKNIITVSGIDKQKVGQTAAEIRSFRRPEPYKGKGIRYLDEEVRRKVGKKAVAEEGASA